MPVKIVIFYHQAAQGWTETWYSNSATINSINFGVSPWTDFLGNSWQMRASDVAIFGARVSNIGSPKQSRIVYFGNKYTATPPNPSASVAPDVTTTDAQFIIYDSNYNKRYIYFRGLADIIISFDAFGNPIVPAQLTNLVNNYIRLAQELQLNLQIMNKPGTAGIVSYSILNAAPSLFNPNWTTIAVSSATTPAFTVGQYLQFHGIDRDQVPGFPSKAIIQRIGAGPALNYDIPYRYRASTVTYNPVKASVQALTYSYPSIGSVGFARFSERKTGRPFGATRGRSRAVVRAQ